LKTAKILCEAEAQGENFDFSARLETYGVSEKEMAAALARGQRYVRRENGKIVLLSEDKLQKISALRTRLGQGGLTGTENVFRRRFSRAELPSAEAALEEIGIGFEPPETWRERSSALRDLSRLARPPVPEKLFSQLRIYQQIGAAWLWHLHKNGLGGLLADEMGLGKTVQAIAYLSAVFAENANRDLLALLVGPAGLIENWRRELARFAPEIPVRVHHGQRRAVDAKTPFPRGVVLTSYSTLAIDLSFFQASEWHTIFADEAQQIKNRRSRNARSLKELFSGTRFVLTGTPIENSHDDLRSLFEFLMPGFLPSGTSASLAAKREWERANLKNLVAPYILRRTKSAVAPELPPRIEQTVWCRFGDAQSRLYEDWKTRSREEIFKLEMAGASDAHLRIAAFSQLLRLRQICTEPRVVSADFPEAESAKLRAFRELLDEAQAAGSRMLVFSQFVSVLDFLADALRSDGIPFCRIDGSTRERTRECDRFNASPEIPVFLISLKAGGLGLNITGADTVVHYDPWWNPAAEAQATDRAHRIGQTKTVTAIKLVVADSVEERVLSLQREKRRLLEELFEASDPANAKISLAEIKELLS
ncbi:MAG: DEAD/DEAH box helicase, partial [Opitutales bacterium]|nr:DEAD/DEAH box helicase [Opitutales bacterium]